MTQPPPYPGPAYQGPPSQGPTDQGPQYPTQQFQVGPPPPVAPPARSRQSRRWLPWALGALAFFVGVGIGGAGAGSKTQNAASATAATTTTATATVTETATVEVTAPGPTKTVVRKVPVTVAPGAATAIGDGTYVVGTDIQPGIYKTAGGGDGACGWSRLSNLSGGFDAIIANGIASGPTTVEVLPGDKAFQLQGGCDWSKIG